LAPHPGEAVALPLKTAVGDTGNNVKSN